MKLTFLRGVQKLAAVEADIEEKEALLVKLRKTLEGYHDLRARYEKVVRDLDTREQEKVRLPWVHVGVHGVGVESSLLHSSLVLGV